MGCASSRKQGELEAVLQKEEEKACLSRLSSKQVDYVLRKHASGLRISQEGLDCAMKELALPTSNEWNTPYQSFFDSFRSLHMYSLPALLISLILLSTSSPVSKLELLFEVLDPTCSNRLSADSFHRLLCSMLKTAVTTAPLLINWPFVAEKETVKAYLTQLEDRVDNATVMLTDRILTGRDEISLSQFLKVVGNESFPDITTCRGLREFLQSVNPANLTRFHSLP